MLVCPSFEHYTNCLSQAAKFWRTLCVSYALNIVAYEALPPGQYSLMPVMIYSLVTMPTCKLIGVINPSLGNLWKTVVGKLEMATTLVQTQSRACLVVSTLTPVMLWLINRESGRCEINTTFCWYPFFYVSYGAIALLFERCQELLLKTYQ